MVTIFICFKLAKLVRSKGKSQQTLIIIIIIDSIISSNWESIKANIVMINKNHIFFKLPCSQSPPSVAYCSKYHL